MIEKVDFLGFKGAKITNSKGDEVILLYGVGPRIISLKTEDGENLFYVKENNFRNVAGSDEWRIYGGTRLWTSVETRWSYLPDNEECILETGENYIKAVSKPDPVTKIQKSIKVEALEKTFRVTYSFKNTGEHLFDAGLWAITCLKPSNDAGIWLPWGEDSSWNIKDMKYWRSWITSSTNVESSQWNPTNEFFIVRPTGEVGKVGFANRWGFGVFKVSRISFVKVSEYRESANYPDGGCSFEVYTCKDFYELETLSPVYTLKPGGEYMHTELWWVGEEDIPTETIESSFNKIEELFG